MSRNRHLGRRPVVSLRTLAIAAIVAVAVLDVGACGVSGDNRTLPYILGEGGLATSESGIDSGGADGADETSIVDGQVGDATTNDGAPLGDGSSGSGTLVLSQVQSRGTAGGSDEFVEIYNSGSVSVTFDAAWTITTRNATGAPAACATALPALLYTGAGQVIPSHKHLLLATSVYSEAVSADATFTAGIPDAASIVLLHAAIAVDALCFSYDATTTTTLTTCATPFTCEGAPATNPHDNTTVTNADSSVERKPGGVGGNGTDTDVNSADFATALAADPHDLANGALP